MQDNAEDCIRNAEEECAGYSKFYVEAERFEGRVEHVASHRSMRFYTLEELLCFIASVLNVARKVEP